MNWTKIRGLILCKNCQTCSNLRRGEGLNNGDQVMVLTKCGEAVTDPETFPNGAGCPEGDDG